MRFEFFRSAVNACLVMASCLGLSAAAQTPVQTNLTFAPAAPSYADTVTGSLTITGTTAGPTGNISYKVDGGTALTTPIVASGLNGLARLNIASQKPGSHTVTWSYAGDANNQSSSGSMQFTSNDLPPAIVGSSYPLRPLIYTQVEGNGYGPFGASGVAVDAAGDVFVSFGNKDTGVAPSVGEITAGFEYKVLSVSGIGTDTQLAVDAAGNLYIADPTHSRVVEYTAGGVQQTLGVTGLQTPRSIAYEASSNSLYILDSGVGGAIRYDLTHNTQSTLFQGLTGLDAPIATDGKGDVFYGQTYHVYEWSTSGVVSEVYNQFDLPSLPGLHQTIQGIAYDVNRSVLWVAISGQSIGLFAIDSTGHLLSFFNDSGQVDDGTSDQIAVDADGHAYGTGDVFTLGSAVNGGPGVSVQPLGAEYFSMPYATAGTTGVEQIYASDVTENPHNIALGGASWPHTVLIPGANQQITVPVYGEGYGVWDAATPGSTASFQVTLSQPGGIASVDPYGGGFSDFLYFTDTAKNTVTFIEWQGASGGPAVLQNKTLAFTGLQQPTQVAADAANDVWVLDKGGAGGTVRIVALNNAGTQSVVYPNAYTPLDSVTTFTAFGDYLYVGGTLNGKGVIERFDGIGSMRTIASGIAAPVAITVDALNNVYAADAGGTLIHIDRTGKMSTVASSLPAPTQLTLLADGTIYLSSANAGDLLAIAPDGTQTHMTIPGTTNPAFAAADDLGNVSFIDGTNNTVYLEQRTLFVEEAFGNTALNTTGKIDFTITNVGNLTVGVLTPANSAPFSLIGRPTNPCVLSSATSVAPGQSCGLELQYTPTQKQADSGDVYLEQRVSGAMNCCGALSDIFDMSGTGVAAVTAPNPVLTPSSLNFGNVTVSTASAAQTATLSNTGNAALTVSSINITGANAGAFAQTNTCGATVAAGASCTISVTCTPASAAALTATLAVNYPSPLAQQAVALACTGTAAAPPTAPEAALTPTSADFGSVNVGSTSASKSFTLANAGNAALPITSVSIAGTNASAFAVASNNCGTSLAAGASCTIAVTFAASASGAASASLSVTDSVGMQSSALTATGAAVGTPDFTIAATPATQTTQAGGSVTYNVQVGTASSSLPFTSAVGLAASGLPTGATATFAPASVTPGASQVTSTMTVTLSALNAKAGASGDKTMLARISFASQFCLFGAAAMRRRRGIRLLLLLLFRLAVSSAALTGCGSGTGFALPGASPTTTTITITGTGGSTVHSTTVTLIVQ